MARLLMVLLIFAALAGCAYNYLQVQRLQVQVNELKAQVARKYTNERRAGTVKSDDDGVSGKVDKVGADQDEIDGWNTLAAQHYAAAQKAVAKSDAPLAAKEYGAYMDDKRKALVLEEKEAANSIDTLRRLAGLNSIPGAPK